MLDNGWYPSCQKATESPPFFYKCTSNRANKGTELTFPHSAQDSQWVEMGGANEGACNPLHAHTCEHMRTSINERILANQTSLYQYVPLSKAMFIKGIHSLFEIILQNRLFASTAHLGKVGDNCDITAPHLNIFHHSSGNSLAGRNLLCRSELR